MRKNNQTPDKDVNRFVVDSLFMTITNANFDKNKFVEQINKALAIRDTLPPADVSCDCQTWKGTTLMEMEIKGAEVGILTCEDEGLYDFMQDALSATLPVQQALKVFLI